MAKLPEQITSNKYVEVFECPACHTAVTARVAFCLDIDTDSTDFFSKDLNVNASVKLSGLKIDHNCIPMQPRG